MSGYALSRLILFSQAEGLALVATAVGLIGLAALATSYFRHYATPDRVPVRLWVPMPDGLTDTPSPGPALYGAPDLKARYRKFMFEGISGASFLHAAALICLLIAAPPRPITDEDRPILIDDCFHLVGDLLREPAEPEGVSWGRQSAGPMPLPATPSIRIPVPTEDTSENLLRAFNQEDLGPGMTGSERVDIWDVPQGGPSFGRKTRESIAPNVEEDVPFFQPVETMPVLVSMNEPLYPALARVQSLEGGVTVRALVSPEGRVERVNIVNPIPLLDAAARAAALTAIFKPAYWNDKPVRVWVEFTIRFNLR